MPPFNETKYKIRYFSASLLAKARPRTFIEVTRRNRSSETDSPYASFTAAFESRGTRICALLDRNLTLRQRYSNGGSGTLSAKEKNV